MSDKKRRTVTLDRENHEFLKKEDNASAVVNDLVKQLREGGDRHTAAIELQLEQKRREREDAAATVERLDREIDELEQFKRSMEQQEDARLAEARDAIGDKDDPTNPAVENWAGKLGMTPEELVDEL